MKGHNQQVKQRGGSTKKVQFKDEAHETELGGSEINDGNVGSTLDILILVELYTHILDFQCFPFLQEKQGLSTHEKELLKMRAKIEQMEQANLEPGTWTMQGEVINRMPFVLLLELWIFLTYDILLMIIYYHFKFKLTK